MNDLERRVKDLLERDASQAPLVSVPPPRLRRRVRIRQVGTAALVSVTMAAVVLVGFAGVRAIDRSEGGTPANDPWAGYPIYRRTATIFNLRISSPSDFYLTRPVAPNIADSPILQLTTYDPGLDEQVCSSTIPGVETNIPAGEAALVVSLQMSQPSGVDPAWPVAVDPNMPITDGPCGRGRYLAFEDTSNFAPYVAWIGTGSGATDDQVRELMRSLETMELVDDGLPGDLGHPSYVIAGGENAKGPWRLEVAPSASAAEGVDLLLVTPSGGPVIAGASTSGTPIRQAGSDPTFGVVTKAASAVELRPDDGSPAVPAHRSPLPPSLPFGFDVFFASYEGNAPTVALALDDSGRVVGTGVTADAVPMTDSGEFLVARFEAFGARWELGVTRGKPRCQSLSNLDTGMGGAGCGDGGSATGGDGGGTASAPPYQFFYGPLPDDAVTAEIVADDGRVYPALAVGATPDGRRYFVIAVEGGGAGSLRMLATDGAVVDRSSVDWEDYGQVINPSKP